MIGPSSAPSLALESALRAELATGERVLWSAQPRADRLKAGFGIWLFALPWTAFSLVWTALAMMPWLVTTQTPEPVKWSFGIVFPLFGLPFIVIGFAMLWSPIRAMRQAGSTLYALTDRRLVRLVLTGKREFASVLLDQMGPIDRKQNADGWGNLRIQTHSRVDGDGDRITERFDVLGVPDVARLERLILEHRKA